LFRWLIWFIRAFILRFNFNGKLYKDMERFRLSLTIFSWLLINQPLSCQIIIDSFVNVTSDYWKQFETKEKSDIEDRDDGIMSVKIFKVKDVTPAITGCEEFREKNAIIDCNERQFSRIFFKYFDASLIHDIPHSSESARCRLRIDKVGWMEEFEVLSKVDKKLESEIIRMITLLKENQITWTPQKARGRVLGEDVFFTIDFSKVLD